MVADPIKAELSKSRPEEGRTYQIGGLRLGSRAGRPPLGSVRSGEARTPPIRTQHQTASTATVQTQSRKTRSQRRAVSSSTDRADKSTVPSHQPHCALHHPLLLAAWRAVEPLRVNRRAHILRAPVDQRLTVGSSPMCIYLSIPGSAYKSPGNSSCVKGERQRHHSYCTSTHIERARREL